MQIGVIGLGKMGGPISKKLKSSSENIIVYDIDSTLRQNFNILGFTVAKDIEELCKQVNVIWLMVPATVVDNVLKEISKFASKKTIIIDSGNSHFTDTQRRAKLLLAQDLFFLDCGTSGGLSGAEHGLCLMVGGEEKIYKEVEFIFKILALQDKAYAYIGPSGSGHYVKMIHNGIEYALLESYAEGFFLMHKNKEYKNLDLAHISELWLNGSIIRSWILELLNKVLNEDQNLEDITGRVDQSGMGLWMVQEAQKENVRVNLIKEALNIRFESQKTGGDYGTKLVALMRHVMGGHKVYKKDKDRE